MTHPVPVIRGPYHPYQRAGCDWQPLFDLLLRAEDPPSITDVAASHSFPYGTLYSVPAMAAVSGCTRYQGRVGAGQGADEVDGRRDNRRVFSREEEQEPCCSQLCLARRVWLITALCSLSPGAL